MDPIALTVYKSPLPKIRIGKNNDGGYVIVDIPDIQYNTLLAGGINGDISFEEHFITKYNGIKCYAFDGTIKKLPKDNTNISFIKKNIGANNSDKLTNIHDIINNTNNIFVKMDIEGGEIPWLQSLSNDQMNKFEQIVMEFHKPFSNKEINTFNNLNKTHYLVHFHPNNNCGVTDYKVIIMPNVFECTYLHKKYFNTLPELNTESIPTKLDQKNINWKPDIIINYQPFVAIDNNILLNKDECNNITSKEVNNFEINKTTKKTFLLKKKE